MRSFITEKKLEGQSKDVYLNYIESGKPLKKYEFIDRLSYALEILSTHNQGVEAYFDIYNDIMSSDVLESYKNIILNKIQIEMNLTEKYTVFAANQGEMNADLFIQECSDLIEILKTIESCFSERKESSWQRSHLEEGFYVGETLQDFINAYFEDEVDADSLFNSVEKSIKVIENTPEIAFDTFLNKTPLIKNMLEVIDFSYVLQSYRESVTQHINDFNDLTIWLDKIENSLQNFEEKIATLDVNMKICSNLTYNHLSQAFFTGSAIRKVKGKPEKRGHRFKRTRPPL